MVMDFLRIGYRVPMRTFQGGPPTPVLWFPAPPDAQWWQHSTPFRSRNWWDETEKENDGLGEQRSDDPCEQPSGVRKDLSYLYSGAHPCPSDEQEARRLFREGGRVGVDPPLVLDADGVAACCGHQAVALSGGIALGGNVDVSMTCYIPYGCRQELRGGVRIGGRLNVVGGIGVGLLGGLRLGGEIALGLLSPPVELTGGVEVGGEIELLAGVVMDMTGGVEVGGEIALLAGLIMDMTGGVEVGGEIALTLVTPPPAFIAGSHTAYTVSPNVNIALASTTPGHLNVVMVVDHGGGTWGTPFGWTQIGSGFGVMTPFSYAVFSKTAGFGEPSPVTFTVTSPSPETAGLSAGWSTPGATTVAGIASEGTVNPCTNNSIILVMAGASMAWFVFVFSPASGFTSITPGWSLGVDGSLDTGNAVIFQDGFPFGNPGAVSADMDDPEDWISVEVVNE